MEIWKLTLDDETTTTTLVSELGTQIEAIQFRDQWSGLAAGGGRLFRTTEGASTWQEVTDLDGSYVSPRKIL